MAGSGKLTVEFTADDKAVRQSMKALAAEAKKTQKADTVQATKAKQQEKKQVKDHFAYQKKLLTDHQRHQKKASIDLHRAEMLQYRNQYRDKVRLDKAHAKERAKVDRKEKFSPSSINQSGGRVVGSVISSLAGIAAGLTGFLIAGAIGAYQKRNEFHKSLGPSIGLGRGKDIKKGIHGAKGARLGFDVVETAGMVPAMARATGVTGPRELQQGMRATGMDQGAVSGVYGTLARSGTSFQGGELKGQSKGGREFAKMIAAGMYSGLEKGRFPEFAEGVTSMMEQRGASASGDVSSEGFSKLLAAMGKTGLSGFQGARGAKLMDKVNQSIVTPGGGEWGQGLMLRAMGFGKPGSGTGYYEARKQQEKGVSDPENMSKYLSQVIAEGGSGKEGALRLSAISGTSLDQSEKLLSLEQSGLTSKEKLSEIGKIMEEGASIEKQSLSAMKGIGGTLERLAGRTNRLVQIGETAAPAIEKLEDLQLKMLEKLVEIVKNFYDDVRTYMGGEGSETTKAALVDLEEDRRKKMGASKGLTPSEYAELAAKHETEVRRADARNAKAVHPSSGFLGKVKDAWNDRESANTRLWDPTPGGMLSDALDARKTTLLPQSGQAAASNFSTNSNLAQMAASELVKEHVGNSPMSPELKSAIDRARDVTANKRALGTYKAGAKPSLDAEAEGTLVEFLKNVRQPKAVIITSPDARVKPSTSKSGSRDGGN